MKRFNKKFVTFAIITLILISAPFHFANAFIFEAIAGVSILAIVGGLLVIIKAILVALIALLADGTTSILALSATNVPVVQESWNLVRQFANMFFIVILVIMAFYTIFDIGGYDFKSLIGRFIVAALLINFSLVIGEYIIDISQTLSNVFINSIGDIGHRIAQGTQIADSVVGDLSTSAVATVDANLWQKTISFFATIILLSIVFFSMAVLFFFSMLRVPVLWALLIFSPVAWITYILPSTKKINQDWWKYFIGWNVFMPFYLFFIYFGTLFLQRKDAILTGINSGTSSGLGITFQSLFFFILIGIVLIGGAKMAMSAGMAAGAGGVAMGVWARGRTAAKFAGSRVPIFGGYSARDIGTGVEAKRKQIREEGLSLGGFKVTSGEQGHRERSARIGAMLGVRGMELQQQREFLTKTEKEYKDIQDKLDVRAITADQIKLGAEKGIATDPKIYAYRKMMAKLGELDPNGDVFAKTLEELSDNPLAAKDFVQAGKEAKYSNMSGSQLIEMSTSIDKDGNDKYTNLRANNLNPAKKEMVKFVQQDERIRSGLTQEQFNRSIDILGSATNADGKSFIKDVGDSRPDLAVEYNFVKKPDGTYAHEEIRNKTIQGFSIQTAGKTDAQIDAEIRERHYAGAVTVGAQKLAQMPAETDPTKPPKVWNRPEFQTALTNHLRGLKTRKNKKAYTTYIADLDKEIKMIL